MPNNLYNSLASTIGLAPFGSPLASQVNDLFVAQTAISGSYSFASTTATAGPTDPINPTNGVATTTPQADAGANLPTAPLAAPNQAASDQLFATLQSLPSADALFATNLGTGNNSISSTMPASAASDGTGGAPGATAQGGGSAITAPAPGAQAPPPAAPLDSSSAAGQALYQPASMQPQAAGAPQGPGAGGGQGSDSSNLSVAAASFSPIEGGLASDPASPLRPYNTPLAAVEGKALTDAVVTILSEAAPVGPVAGYATIDWGDNTDSTLGAFRQLPDGEWQVLGSHTYHEDGTFVVSTTIDHDEANKARTYAVVADANLTATATTFTATEGAPVANGTVATFTDANPGASAADFSGTTIAWGDGTTSAGTVTGAGSTYSVTGTHTYATGGAMRAVVTIKDNGGTSTEVNSLVPVANLPLVAGTVTLTDATEGVDTTLTATVTDSASAPTGAAYTAAVSWGDGDTSGATVTGSGGTLGAQINHTYLNPGTYIPSVTFTDEGGATVTETGTVTVTDLPLTATGGTFYTTPGTTGLPLVVATFTDANTDTAVADYTATINWADGSAIDGGTIIDNAGSFIVTGSHSYATTGTFHPSVTIQDETSTTTANGSAFVSTMTPLAQPFTTSEGGGTGGGGGTFGGGGGTEGGGGGSSTVVATFTDTQPSSYTASINWGDGTPATPGVLSGFGGSYSVSGTHVYAEGGDYAVTTTVTNATGLTTAVISSATVSDPALSATGANVTLPIWAPATDVTVATFSDASPSNGSGDYSASIDWGDGSTPGLDAGVTSVNGTLTVLGAHQFTTAGTFTVTTTVADAGGATTTTTSTAIVTSALSAGPATLTTFEGNPATTLTVATYYGNAAGYTASIDWGDNTPPTQGTFTTSTVQGTHTYAEMGDYSATVTFTDASGLATAFVTTPATVADGTLSTVTAPALRGVQGHALSGVLATFADANPNAPLTDFTAIITWGDGIETAGTVTGSAGALSVTGSNTYFGSGTYHIVVTLTDADGASTGTPVQVTIDDAPLGGPTITLTPTQGVAMSGVTLDIFTDDYSHNVASDYQTMIDWGDGTPVGPGHVTGGGGLFSIQSNHTYALAGLYTVHVGLTDWDGGTIISGTATVSPPPVYTVATIADANVNDTASSLSATIDWGDGTATTAGIITGGNGSFAVSGAHTYGEEGNYTVSVAVADPSNNVLPQTDLIYVQPAQKAIGKDTGPVAATPKIQVQEVNFSGRGLLVVSSDDNKEYGSTWESAKLPAIGLAALFQQDPLAYVRDNTLGISRLTFQVQAGQETITDPVMAFGSVSGIGIAAGTEIDVPLSLSVDHKLLRHFGAVITANKAFDAVTNTVLTIDWSIQIGNGQIIRAGTTSNQLYVTYAESVNTRPLYESVLNAGSVYNGGLHDTIDTVTNNAWKAFQAREVVSIKALKAGGNDILLKYYGTYGVGQIDKTDVLLASQDGGCVGWATYWIDALEAQGIHQENWFYAIKPDQTDNDWSWQIVVKKWTYDDPTNLHFTFPGQIAEAGVVSNFPTLGGRKFYVNTFTPPTLLNQSPMVGAHQYNWLTAQVNQAPKDKGNLPGQGNPAPASLFYGHNLVLIGNKFYDPSYGTIYDAPTSEKGIENFRKNLDGFALQPLNLRLDAQQNYAANGEVTPVVLFLKPGDPTEPQIRRFDDQTMNNY